MTDKRKLFVLPALLLLAAGCNSFRTQTYVDGLAMPLREGSQDSLLFDISLEYAVKGLPEEVIGTMNGNILTLAFDLEDAPGDIEETAVRYRENLVDQYFSENENATLEPGFATWEDRIGGMFAQPYKDWMNYQMAYYSYRGGVHGVQTLTNLVFDKQTGRSLTEEDLLAPGYADPLTALLYGRIIENLDKEDESLAELVEKDWVTANGNFSVGADGVTWYFQPYEIGPYALGVVTATLSWEELKPLLKP